MVYRATRETAVGLSCRRQKAMSPHGGQAALDGVWGPVLGLKRPLVAGQRTFEVERGS